MKLIKVAKKDDSSNLAFVSKIIGKANFDIESAKARLEMLQEYAKRLDEKEVNKILVYMQYMDKSIKQLQEAEKQFLALLK